MFLIAGLILIAANYADVIRVIIEQILIANFKKVEFLLSLQNENYSHGRLVERSITPSWKGGEPERVPWVRIPHLPQIIL